MSIEAQLKKLVQKLNRLPEADEPPPTTLQILGRNRQEQDWQRLLFYYLSPDVSHGLDSALLEHFLSALGGRDELDYTFSRFDLEDIQIETEVITSDGRRPDALMWSSEDWFICWELKVDASEGDDQTSDYVVADSFRSVNLNKDDVPSEDHHYIFLAPENAAPPEANEFDKITWEWVRTELQEFLIESHGEYPARTTAQINDFIGTIRSELTMTEYQENQQEKVELYLDHYQEISDVQQAFEKQWGEFIETWGDRLSQALDTAIVTHDATVPEEYVSVEIAMKNDETRLWTFRQGNDDWAWMFPRQWWRNLDKKRPIYDRQSPMARVGFLHRLGQNQEKALRDNKLIFYLRNAPTADDDFHDGFQRRFNFDSEIEQLLPRKTSRPGRKANVLEAIYDIDVDSHSDFFEAYIAALSRAMDEHVVSNPELMNRIDTIYEQTIEEDTEF